MREEDNANSIVVPAKTPAKEAENQFKAETRRGTPLCGVTRKAPSEATLAKLRPDKDTKAFLA